MRRLAVLLLWLGLPACTYVAGDPNVLITSVPPGARIFVDGVDTGCTTPTRLELDGFFGENHIITLKMEGHEPETREVVHRRVWAGSRWIDGTDLRVFAFPLFWTFGDFFTPMEVDYLYVPSEVYAVLWKTGEAPVKSDDIVFDPPGVDAAR